jgi:hypothetical protein
MGTLSSVDLYFLAVATFVTCRLSLTAIHMLEAIIQHGLDRDEDGEDQDPPASCPQSQ